MSKFGPDFLSADSRVFKFEFFALSIALLAIMWGRTDALLAAAFFIFPDIVFIPILLASRKGAWPKWGASLYNATHTFIVWVPLAALAWLFAPQFFWPSLAWGLHICVDRALGFRLRANQ